VKNTACQDWLCGLHVRQATAPRRLVPLPRNQAITVITRNLRKPERNNQKMMQNELNIHLNQCIFEKLWLHLRISASN